MQKQQLQEDGGKQDWDVAYTTGTCIRMRLIKTPSIPFTPPKCLWKEKIQGDYIELLWSTTWSSKVGLRCGWGQQLKVLWCTNGKTFHSSTTSLFLYSFLSPFFCFSWARVYDAGGEHPGVLAARLPGTQASTMAVRGGAMTQQDTGPDFDTVALLLFCVLTLAQWLTTTATTLGRTARIMQDRVE